MIPKNQTLLGAIWLLSNYKCNQLPDNFWVRNIVTIYSTEIQEVKNDSNACLLTFALVNNYKDEN
jgi:hypothetical protein